MRVIFIPYKDASFVRADKEIIESFSKVESINLEWSKKHAIPVSFIVQFFWLLRHIKNTDIIVCSFASYSSVLPSIVGWLFNRKLITIIHGTECAAIPSIEYGMTRKWLLRKCIFLSLSLSEKIVVSNKKLIFSEDSYTSGFVGNQGLSKFYDLSQSKYQVIPYGVDDSFWQNTDSNRVLNSFISVVLPGQELRRDLPMIYEVAKSLPNHTFEIAGLQESTINEAKPDNVHLLGILTPEELRNAYSRSAYFLQLSLYEGFGLSLTEAVLCGCTPIASNVNAVPSILENDGYLIHKRSPDSIINTIKNALSNKPEHQHDRLMTRIVVKYDIQSRKESLKAVLHSIVD